MNWMHKGVACNCGNLILLFPIRFIQICWTRSLDAANPGCTVVLHTVRGLGGGGRLQEQHGGAGGELGALRALLGAAAHQGGTRTRSPAAPTPPQATCEQVRLGTATDRPPAVAVVEISSPK